MRVHIFIPCFMDQLYPSVGFNMVKVLRKAGCEVVYNSRQTCCGQPAFNAGFHDDAREVCTKFMQDFSEAAVVVVPSASCAGFVKNYYSPLFAGTGSEKEAAAMAARVTEFSHFLVHQLGVEDFGATLEGTAAYHDSCAALRECGIREEPRRLLSKVKGLTLKELTDNTVCCGFGGTFAVKFDAISGAMADQKLSHTADTGAQYLISTDMSCLMHLQGAATQKKMPLNCLHLADVLASGW